MTTTTGGPTKPNITPSIEFEGAIFLSYTLLWRGLAYHLSEKIRKKIELQLSIFNIFRIFAGLFWANNSNHLINLLEMSKICEITGKTAQSGNNVSHSNRRTKRKFNLNLKTKRFWSEEENRWITLKVTAAGIKTINKKGLDAALKEAKAPAQIH